VQATDVLIDGFGRIAEEVQRVLDGAGTDLLQYRADDSANTIAWLIWHLTRVQDDHIADAFGTEQLWTERGFADRFDLPFDVGATGYGFTSDDVAAVHVSAELLLEYHGAVHGRTVELLHGTDPAELERIVDERWNPPVTLAVRLVSVLSDDLQHVGQAAYVRGLAERTAR
jgi:hypothetical protein